MTQPITQKNTTHKTPTSKPAASTLHPRNPHQGRYDFDKLIKALPELEKHAITNPSGEATINFSDADAVLTLNKALLALHYGIKYWDLPKGYLCPPIPGRADYIHQVADLLADNNSGSENKKPHVLDIGTGASLIYPIVGSQSYGWYFTATDIDPVSINTAKTICEINPNLKKLVTVKQQKNPKNIFKGIIGEHDYFDITVCNPPFHGSMQEVLDANNRKQTKLQKNRARRNPNSQTANKFADAKNNLNFGGQNAELWTEGGEFAFISRMINESVDYAQQVNWFTTLVSRAENLKPLDALLRRVGARQIKTINMQHGQKASRILAWRFK
ncbi:23S rRNA (adenine(1618)-N(6))-methyltransferase RlmF [Psychrobacter sanguinis]|uniref:23S rRNA (adenine(1618)-N(6))-methyltransferase RlmF n=1 Tax=Psychrobacter sanguinis TaxID=861445 RepID=UPI0019196679|nr:23S rRNA (adenine(1618)-N(6))-methyltransferase RlmF [Psychrobacter sanguinis]MCC3309054.1 23S rRNA (adenine(1618)-N(6))-methyltransferase RlmF [Psychrobacter sanguinis]UEC26339.1 23S rRNA (adenine(1618)-N(6))-methyltransferase RlmF [Psychrobacter sanguinis]